MEKILPLVYFVSGAVTTMIALSTVSYKKDEKKKEKKNWTKISKICYDFNVDHEFKEVVSGEEIIVSMAEIMKINASKFPSELRTQKVEAGSYSISCVSTINFVHRESK